MHFDVIIRASAVGRNMRCSRSLLFNGEPELEVKSDTETQDTSGSIAGTMKHAQIAGILARYVAGESSRSEVADFPFDVRLVIEAGMEIIDNFRNTHGNNARVLIESALSLGVSENSGYRFTLAGHPDLALVAPTEVQVWDWKMGWGAIGEIENMQQVIAYVALLTDGGTSLPDGGQVLVGVLAPHQEFSDGCIESKYVAKASIEDFMRKLRGMCRRAVTGDIATPGSYCTFCKNIRQCPEAIALVKKTRNLDVAGFKRSLPGMTTQQLADVYENAQVAKAVVEAVYAEVRQRLVESDNTLSEQLRAKLSKAGERDVVTDPLKLLNAVADILGGSYEPLLGTDAVKISLPKAVAAMSRLTGLSKKTVSDAIGTIAADAIVRKPTTQRLIPIRKG